MTTPSSNSQGQLSIFNGQVDDPPSDWEIIQAIWAIPATVFSAQANKLLCVHVNHCGCGRSVSVASNETLAFEAGVEIPQVSKTNAMLVHGSEAKPGGSPGRRSRPMEGGWLIEHRHGRSKFAERHFEIGPTTWEWVRRNLAEMTARREENRARRAIPAPRATQKST